MSAKFLVGRESFSHGASPSRALHSPKKKKERADGPRVIELRVSMLKSVELFAGGGGMALGTAAAGFRHLALLELNPNAVSTLRANADTGAGARAEIPIAKTDVTRYSYGQFRGEGVDLLAGGAPCQPFSLGGRHNGHLDRRNLFPEVFRAQRELTPAAVLLENVRGLARPSFRPYLEYILLQLGLPFFPPTEHEGWELHKSRLLGHLERGACDTTTYDVRIRVLECADYGVPQRRSRIFIVAFRTDLDIEWVWPKATHSRERLEESKWITGEYWKHHGLTPSTSAADLTTVEVADRGARERWRTVRDALGSLPAPVGDPVNATHPNHILIPGARAYPGHTGSPWDEPAKTLKAGVHGVPGGENMLRLDDGSVRYFSVHESAILQTFPPEYIFRGSRTEAMRQIGNAAPPRVVERIAYKIRDSLRDSERGSMRVPMVDLVTSAQISFA